MSWKSFICRIWQGLGYLKKLFVSIPVDICLWPCCCKSDAIDKFFAIRIDSAESLYKAGLELHVSSPTWVVEALAAQLAASLVQTENYKYLSCFF